VLTAAPRRVLVTIDPELGDLNSMLRLLPYSNEIDIAALRAIIADGNIDEAGDTSRCTSTMDCPSEPRRLA
jgi:hypothetical protein